MTHFTAAVIPELPKIVPRRPIERASDIEEKRGREGGREGHGPLYGDHFRRLNRCEIVANRDRLRHQIRGAFLIFGKVDGSMSCSSKGRLKSVQTSSSNSKSYMKLGTMIS